MALTNLIANFLNHSKQKRFLHFGLVASLIFFCCCKLAMIFLGALFPPGDRPHAYYRAGIKRNFVSYSKKLHKCKDVRHQASLTSHSPEDIPYILTRCISQYLSRSFQVCNQKKNSLIDVTQLETEPLAFLP